MSLLWIFFVICYFCLSLPILDVCLLQPCGHLLGKSWPLGSLECDGVLCFCHFPIPCPWSGVVLDCIESWSLPSSLLLINDMILTDFNWSSCICGVIERHTKSVQLVLFSVCKRCIWCSVLINIRCAADANKYSKPSADWSVHSIALPRQFYISFKNC